MWGQTAQGKPTLGITKLFCVLSRLRPWPTWTEPLLSMPSGTPSWPSYLKERWTPSRGGILRLLPGWFICWDRRSWATCSRSMDLWLVIAYHTMDNMWNEWGTIKINAREEYKEACTVFTVNSFLLFVFFLANIYNEENPSPFLQLVVWLSTPPPVSGMQGIQSPTCPLWPSCLCLKRFPSLPLLWSCSTHSVALVHTHTHRHAHKYLQTQAQCLFKVNPINADDSKHLSKGAGGSGCSEVCNCSFAYEIYTYWQNMEHLVPPLNLSCLDYCN